jgi:hypothetical protein
MSCFICRDAGVTFLLLRVFLPLVDEGALCAILNQNQRGKSHQERTLRLLDPSP